MGEEAGCAPRVVEWEREEGGFGCAAGGKQRNGKRTRREVEGLNIYMGRRGRSWGLVASLLSVCILFWSQDGGWQEDLGGGQRCM